MVQLVCFRSWYHSDTQNLSFLCLYIFCWSSQMWICFTLTKAQITQAFSCSFRLLTCSLTHSVVTNNMFWFIAWLLDLLGIWEVEHISVSCILLKMSFVLPFQFGLRKSIWKINTSGFSIHWVTLYGILCLSQFLLFFCIFLHNISYPHPPTWNKWTCQVYNLPYVIIR